MAYLTDKERYVIETMLKDKKPVKEIAERLGKHYNTIYYEIKKGTVELLGKDLKPYTIYLADVSIRITKERCSAKGRDLKIGSDHKTADLIEYLILKKKYSPYAVAQYLRTHEGYTSLCEQTLYNYIYAGLFLHVNKHYLHYRKRKKKKYDDTSRPSYKNLKGKSIDKRPEGATNRTEYGHWECDTVYSKKNTKACLLVLTERLTNEEILVKCKNRSHVSILSAFRQLEKRYGFEQFSRTFKTITCDNGTEFSNGKSIEQSSLCDSLRTSVYFCHPYSSFERGQNEKQNTLIRYFIPKGTDIGKYSHAQIQEIQDWINDYPRKKYGGLSSRQYKKSLGI